MICNDENATSSEKQKEATIFCKAKKKSWLDEMIISPSFKNPPGLYAFVKDIPDNIKEESILKKK